MKKILIAAAVMAVSGFAFAGGGTFASSDSSSGGATSAAVYGKGYFTANDKGSAVGAAGAIAGSGHDVAGNGVISYTNHTNTSTAAGFGRGTAQATGMSGADAAAKGWATLGKSFSH